MPNPRDRVGAVAAHDEAMELCRQRSGVWGECVCLEQLATVATDEGELCRAPDLHARALRRDRAPGEPVCAYADLLGLADAALAAGHPGAAARLLGAEEATRSTSGPEDSGAAARARRRIHRALGARLGDEACGRAWSAGRLLTTELAVADACAPAKDIAAGVPPNPAIPPEARSAPAAPEPGNDVTRRERKVLVLLCQRLTNAEIAERLCINEAPARNRVASRLGKPDGHDRHRAAAIPVKVAYCVAAACDSTHDCRRTAALAVKGRPVEQS